MKRAAGFSLIEVLIALAVLAISLAALIQTSTGSVRTGTWLKEQTMAHWAAMNEITRMQVTREWPKPGTSNTTATMGDADFALQRIVYATEIDTLRRVEIEVSMPAEPDTPLVTLTGFLNKQVSEPPLGTILRP